MIFKEHLSKESGLSDLLNYAHFIDDGLILNKDGAFLVTYEFSGPDFYSASPAELDALTATFSRMTTYLNDGWMLHIEEYDCLIVFLRKKIISKVKLHNLFMHSRKKFCLVIKRIIITYNF